MQAVVSSAASMAVADRSRVVDGKALRNAFGRFATGVTIITARDAAGRPLGMTANSFTSLSLDPPLVLWSLARTSSNLEAYRQAPNFAINVLSLEQEALCHRFASRVEGDRFEGMALAPGLLDAPLLQGALAHFECRKWAEYEVGDHIAFVGQVERFDTTPGDPLLFNAGRLCAGAVPLQAMAA